MSTFVVVTLILLTCAGMTYGSFAMEEEFDKKVELFGLFRMLDECVFVAVGRVDLLEGVYRKNLHYDEYHRSWSSFMCTDVYFRIEYLVKGEPNLGKNYRRFIYQGGTGYNPDLDEITSMSVSIEPGYEVGDKMFLFLTNKPDGSGYRAGWPYDGCYVYFGGYRQYGNQMLEGEHPTVGFTYPRADGSRHRYRIPIQVAVNIARAYVADKEAAMQLEDIIKEKALESVKGEYDLPQELLTQLNEVAKDIMEGREPRTFDWKIWLKPQEPSNESVD